MTPETKPNSELNIEKDNDKDLAALYAKPNKSKLWKDKTVGKVD